MLKIASQVLAKKNGGLEFFSHEFNVRKTMVFPMKTMILFSISLIALCCITTLVYAQPGLPSAPSQAPIDGGLGLLAAAGAVYAWKKLRGKKDEK